MTSSRSGATKPSSISSCSVRSRRGRKCGCDARMVSYVCKNGRNKGRLFWRCPFWQSEETCDLFIWDEDLVTEDLTVVEEVENYRMKELETVELLRELYEGSKKKNMKMQDKLRAEAWAGKIKLICFVVSLMINVILLMKCKC